MQIINEEVSEIIEVDSDGESVATASEMAVANINTLNVSQHEP